MKEKVREIDSEFTELKFMIPESTFQKMNEVKDLIGNESLSELFNQALDALIRENKKKRGRVENKTLKSESKVHQKSKSTLPATQSRFIPIDEKREVSVRSGNQCEFIDPKTNIRCSSRYRLEFDHRVPYAHGGKNFASNLRHYCRQHNLKAAMDVGL